MCSPRVVSGKKTTSGSGKYVADVRRNGRPQRDWKVDASFLYGGSLDFRLSETPTAWGS